MGPYRSLLKFLFTFLLVALFIRGGGLSAENSPSPEPTPRTSEVCLGCHEGQDQSLAKTAHALSSDALDGEAARIACTDCHRGDPRHWEESATDYPMANPSKLGALAAAHVCSSCHQNAHQQGALEGNVHSEHDVNCSGCHSVHGSAHPALLKKPQRELCMSCHAGVEGQFARPYRHPVNDGIVECSQCHLTIDKTPRESLAGGSFCTSCHAEFEGPFPYEHQATVHYSTEEGGCMSCHEPHGGYLPRMLKQPYEYPHYELCSQCHSVPRHNSNMKHGTMWAGVACNTCHVDIHGSYTNRFFLSESLEGEGCLKAGCHGR